MSTTTTAISTPANAQLHLTHDQLDDELEEASIAPLFFFRRASLAASSAAAEDEEDSVFGSLALRIESCSTCPDLSSLLKRIFGCRQAGGTEGAYQTGCRFNESTC